MFAIWYDFLPLMSTREMPECGEKEVADALAMWTYGCLIPRTDRRRSLAETKPLN